MIGILARLFLAASVIAVFFSATHAIAFALISIAFQVDFLGDAAIKFANWIIDFSKKDRK